MMYCSLKLFLCLYSLRSFFSSGCMCSSHSAALTPCELHGTAVVAESSAGYSCFHLGTTWQFEYASKPNRIFFFLNCVQKSYQNEEGNLLLCVKPSERVSYPLWWQDQLLSLHSQTVCSFVEKSLGGKHYKCCQYDKKGFKELERH